MPSDCSPSVSTVIVLRRSGPVRNMHRYYRLTVERTLFGEWACVREWGRIGSPGQMRSTAYATPAEAQAVLDRLLRVKQRRG